ncbi:hypothetical protein ACTXT7_011003 [Hymenolepis weldensis]
MFCSISVVPVSSMVLPIATLVQASNGNLKLHPSVRDFVKVTGLMHSMGSCMPKIILAQRVSKPTVSKQQSVSKSHPPDHQTNQICYLNEDKEG